MVAGMLEYDGCADVQLWLAPEFAGPEASAGLLLVVVVGSSTVVDVACTETTFATATACTGKEVGVVCDGGAEARPWLAPEFAGPGAAAGRFCCVVVAELLAAVDVAETLVA